MTCFQVKYFDLRDFSRSLVQKFSIRSEWGRSEDLYAPLKDLKSCVYSILKLLWLQATDDIDSNPKLIPFMLAGSKPRPLVDIKLPHSLIGNLFLESVYAARMRNMQNVNAIYLLHFAAFAHFGTQIIDSRDGNLKSKMRKISIFQINKMSKKCIIFFSIFFL